MPKCCIMVERNMGVSYSVGSRTFWSQTRALTKANLKARYRKTFAGFIWVVLNPVIMFSVQALIFKKILRLQVDHYPLFLLSGLIPWIFISQSIDMTISIFVNSSQLIKSYPVHPLVYLVAQIIDNFINFVAAFLCILIPVSLREPVSVKAFIMLPVSFIVLVIGVIGVSWLLATVQVFFRDLRYIMNFVMSVGFFLTPIFYPIQFIPPNLKWLVVFNPFYRMIEPFHAILIDFSWQEFMRTTAISLAVSVGLLILASVVWAIKRNEIYFRV